MLETGLLDLGHQVSISEKRVSREAINIFIENFNLDSVQYFETLVKRGYHFGIYATEVFDGSAFNWRSDPVWANRFDAFKKIAPYAKFIWVMYEDSLNFYSKFAPSAFLPLGYSEKLLAYEETNTPRFDFGFWGIPTPHRINLFQKLKKYGSVAWPSQFLPEAQLDDFLQQIKIGIDLKQSEHWPAPSPVRIPRLVMARRGIITEKTKILGSNGPGKLLVETIPYFPDDDEFINFMHTSLASWKNNADVTLEHYKTKLPMARLIECALESSLYDSNNLKKHNLQSYKHQPYLIFHYYGYNIVQKGEHYLALSIKTHIDLDSGFRELLNHRRSKHLFIAKSIEILMRKIDINALTSELSIDKNQIELISEYKDHIIARKNNNYLAINKKNINDSNSIDSQLLDRKNFITTDSIDSLINLINLAEIFSPIKELDLFEYCE